MEHVLEAPARPPGAPTLASEPPEAAPASSRVLLTPAPTGVRSLTPVPRLRSQPPPKPVRPSVAPAATPVPSASAQPASVRPARPSLLPTSSQPPVAVAKPATNGKATPPPPPSRRPDTQRPPATATPRSPALWSGRDAARVSIVKSSTEPGLYYVRLIENGKPPAEGVEGLLVALDPDATLTP